MDHELSPCSDEMQFAVNASLWTVIALAMFIFAEVKLRGLAFF